MKDFGSPSESVLHRIEGYARSQHSSGYEEGYVDGYHHTRKYIARRSVVALLVGVLLGGALMGVAATKGVFGENLNPFAADPIELGEKRGTRYKAATDFAKDYTVGIIAQQGSRSIFDKHTLTRIKHLGSGFLFDNHGHIVTNLHVIRNANRYKVIWKKREYSAALVGSSHDLDVAVLRINTTEVKGAALLDPKDKVFQAEEVLAIGSPRGLHYTVTQGIISHVDRVIADESTAQFSIPYLQTDAAINPGNSGGPLVNLEGRVVGMNSWIITESGDSSGLGFAIPIDLVRKAANEIIAKYGSQEAEGENPDEGIPLERAYLGVDIDPRITKYIVIAKVHPNTMAFDAGLKPKDIIHSVDGKVFKNFQTLIAYIQSRTPGDKIDLRIIRSGKSKIISTSLGSRPNDGAIR